MSDLNIRAFGGLVFFVSALGILLFATAWTAQYWQAWLYIGLFSVSIILITLYLVWHDPELLARRMNVGSPAETEQSQKIIQFLAQFAFMAEYILPALDKRLGWSMVPTGAVIAADVGVVLGLGIVFFVFRENTYTSAVIEIADDQQVVSTGPYSIVRHPMYTGALIMLLVTPIALGSWWGLLAFFPMFAVIVWRLTEEEKYLLENLRDYGVYRSQVRFRLFPGVF